MVVMVMNELAQQVLMSTPCQWCNTDPACREQMTTGLLQPTHCHQSHSKQSYVLKAAAQREDEIMNVKCSRIFVGKVD